jgi:hypothetical protein
MASTPIPINAEVTNAATTLYTAFVVGGATFAQLVSLDLQNKTSSEVTIDVWIESAGAVVRLLADDLPLRPKAHASWRGVAVLATAGQLIRAQASVAVSVDAIGTVVENA